MFKIGVTGSFGSGKTTVSAMFKKCGAGVVDADGIIHQLLSEHKGCRQAIARVFGREILTDGHIDRNKLGKVVFSDPKALQKLEAILHPLAWKEVEKAFRSARKTVVVLDAPLLIEAKWHNKVDAVVVVKAHLPQQVKRLKSRTGLRRADVLRRIRRQMSLKKKLAYADFVVDNSKNKSDTDKQVKKIWDHLRRLTNNRE